MTSVTGGGTAATARGELTIAELLDRDDAIDLGGGPAWLRAVRGSAIERARELGFPTARDEEWRYTDPSKILGIGFADPGAGEPVVGSAAGDLVPLDVDSAARLVFVDGVLDESRSQFETLPEGVTISPLGAMDERIAAGIEPVQAALADGVSLARDGFEALGAGLLTEGMVVHIARDIALDRPLVVVFASSGQGSRLGAPCVVVVAEPGSRVEVIEDHQCFEEGEGVSGVSLGRTGVRVGEGAHVEHTLIQRESASRGAVMTLDLEQEGESFFRSNRVLMGGSVVRNNILARIVGEKSETAFNGIFVPEANQHHDTHIRVEHLVPGCHSRQFYRGILSDRARGVFTGRIYVKDIAQQTDAIQSNSNLLLSASARMVTKPQLEIYADDVRCTHGATSGQLDEDAMFYLRARGVGQRAARLLLLHAFAAENVDRIANESLREIVRGLINDRLDAALARQG